MNNELLKIFIGYDPVESVAWHTMAHSILEQSSKPIALIPLNLSNLGAVYKRERDPKQSNEFSFTRFLVPHLAGFNGYALFFDCDMMLRGDVMKIFDVLKSQPNKALYVVKHSYQPRDDIKYLNTVQYSYPRKNWSSVVLWNCDHPAHKVLTPEYINTASGLALHRFTWLKDEEIGELDLRWNWLVGEYDEPPTDVLNVHWTVGGPYFHEYKDVPFSSEWLEIFKKMTFCLQRIPADTK